MYRLNINSIGKYPTTTSVWIMEITEEEYVKLTTYDRLHYSRI